MTQYSICSNNLRAFQLEPAQDVFGQPAIVGAGFHNPQSAVRRPHLLQPFGELEGEQPAKKFANAGAGVEIAMTPRIVFICFIVSMNWTIKGEFHEAREGQNAAFGGFPADDFKQRVHNLRLARL